jgi:tetratricopeptide (TPR) repeat protein/predicted Ser/Thr protein kinase
MPITPETEAPSGPLAAAVPFRAVEPTVKLQRPAPATRGQRTTERPRLVDDPPSAGDRPAGRSGDEPTRIGRFVIIRRIGAGGMGVVYSAYDEELDRKVAIKLLHADRSGSQGRARILREAQALARLSHPNIVHVYEVGEYDGQVFMAMEFVEGITVDEWSHRQSRPWRALLAVYRQAAQGLAAAHEAGLVHRDVKPENMLIDARGRVILLDFGLARMRGEDSHNPTSDDHPHSAAAATTGGGPIDPAARTAAHTLTAAGTIMGTPAYMSPEQCAGVGADARSDQFSFCVSLYEGLYGERPFAGDDLNALILAICQGDVREPPRGAKVPTWLRRVLLRGLAVKPSERWPSMQTLAEALADDPAGRRRWYAGAAVAVTLSAAALGAWQPWSSDEVCRGADQRLAQVWSEPQQHAVHAALSATGYAYAEQSWAQIERRLGAYTAAWAQLYAGACEAHHRGESSAELYDRQMSCLDGRLREVKAMVDVLTAADATVVQQTPEILLGLPPLTTCGDADALSKSYAPPPDQKTAEAVEATRQQLLDVRMRREAGHALAVRDRAEGIVRAARTLGYRPLVAEALLELAVNYMALDQTREAEATLADAFLTADAVRHDSVAADAGAWLVFLIAREGRGTEAQLRAEHVKAVLERYGRTSQADVNLHRGLAILDLYAGRYDEARRVLGHALSIAESLPEGQGERLATLILVNIGQVCEFHGDIACTSANFERALARYSERVGEGDPKLGLYKAMLANARMSQGRPEEAATLFEESVAHARAAFGDRHPVYLKSIIPQSKFHLHRGDLLAASALAEEARALARALFGEAHMETLWASLTSAAALVQRGRYQDAEALLDEAALIRAKPSAEPGPEDSFLHAARGDLYNALGRYQDAKLAFDAYFAVRAQALMHATNRASAEAGRARALLHLGDRAAAAAALDRIEREISAINTDHWALIEPLHVSAELALAEGRDSDAAAAAERALRLLERHSRPPVPSASIGLLAARALATSDPPRAREFARRALADQRRVTGAPPERAEEILTWLRDHGAEPE